MRHKRNARNRDQVLGNAWSTTSVHGTCSNPHGVLKQKREKQELSGYTLSSGEQSMVRSYHEEMIVVVLPGIADHSF